MNKTIAFDLGVKGAYAYHTNENVIWTKAFDLDTKKHFLQRLKTLSNLFTNLQRKELKGGCDLIYPNTNNFKNFNWKTGMQLTMYNGALCSRLNDGFIFEIFEYKAYKWLCDRFGELVFEHSNHLSDKFGEWDKIKHKKKRTQMALSSILRYDFKGWKVIGNWTTNYDEADALMMLLYHMSYYVKSKTQN